MGKPTLTLLAKRNKDTTATIYTKGVSKQLRLDINKHNSQYPEIKVSDGVRSQCNHLDHSSIIH